LLDRDSGPEELKIAVCADVEGVAIGIVIGASFE